MELDIHKLASFINTKLNNGYSTAEIERKILKVGKDTARKKLYRSNYIYNKETNQYEYAPKPQEEKKKEPVTVENKPIEPSKPIVKQTKTNKEESVLTPQNFQEFMSLQQDIKALLETFKNNGTVINLEPHREAVYSDFKGILQGTTLQLYKEVWDALEEFIQANKLTKKVVVNQAIWEFIQKYKHKE
jgi:uncharacterized protein (DUF849 family)